MDGERMEHKDLHFMEAWMSKLKQTHNPRSEMNRIVMNYLEKEGYKDAAEKFCHESGTQPSAALDTLERRIVIRDRIQAGEITSAIAAINEIHPELLDNDNYLYFHLQQQQLIEMIRSKKIEEALNFAQSHLAERAEESTEVLKEMERTLALLAFDEPEESPFADLYALSHRVKLAGEVNARILEQENQESTPKLTKVLQLLTWSQEQLDAKNVKYVKMTDFANGKLHLSNN